MKLYYAPGACSLAPHIVAREAGIDLQLDKVDWATKKTASGKDFAAVNPKGYVPALELDDGQLLTEGPVIQQYLADQKPASGLAPANGTLERYRLQEVLTYINSEIHKQFGPLFNPNITPEAKEYQFSTLRRRFEFLDKGLAGKQFLLGDKFTVADAYLFVMLSWADHMKLDISALKNLAAYKQRVFGRPAVQAAMKAEGLIQ
ncbi:MAG TPA: glutathione transferase GstA [Gammaproteobacteria bacterium]|nr:glutathione transferase GstA [Gammaproteobacteria bacterium]